MKHPKWRVHDYAIIDADVRADLESRIMGVIAEIPPSARSRILDVVILGSYARGQAQLHSDLDFGIILTANDLDAFYDTAHQPGKFKRVADAMEAIRADLQIELDLFVDVDPYDRKQCYSIPNRVWYNRDLGQTYDTVWRWKDGNWITIARPQGRFMSEEPDPPDTDYWRNLYGQAYQEWGNTADTVNTARG